MAGIGMAGMAILSSLFLLVFFHSFCLSAFKQILVSQRVEASWSQAIFLGLAFGFPS